MSADAASTEKCPKCGTPVGGAPACKKCGLVATKLAEFSAKRESFVPRSVLAAWEAVDANWSDPHLHDVLLGVVAEFDQFAWAASKYRERTGDAIALAQLARIARAAEATMLASASARPEKASPYKSLTLLLGVFVFVILAGVFYAMVIQAKTENQPPPPPAGVPTKPGVR